MFQLMLRLSGDDIRVRATSIAGHVERIFGMDGSTILLGNLGRWKGKLEQGAIVEIVVNNKPTKEELDKLRSIVVSYGLTSYMTIAQVEVEELY